jgi:hypothetical protein
MGKREGVMREHEGVDIPCVFGFRAVTWAIFLRFLARFVLAKMRQLDTASDTVILE